MDLTTLTSTGLTALNVFWMIVLVLFGTVTTYISLHMIYVELKQKLAHHPKIAADDALDFPTVQDA